MLYEVITWVAEQLEELEGFAPGVIIAHNSKMTSKLKGIRKCNEEFWQKDMYNTDIELFSDDSLREAEFRLNISD